MPSVPLACFSEKPDLKRFFNSTTSSSSFSSNFTPPTDQASTRTTFSSPATFQFQSSFNPTSSAPSKSYSEILEQRIANRNAQTVRMLTLSDLHSKFSHTAYWKSGFQPQMKKVEHSTQPYTFSWQEDHMKILESVDSTKDGTVESEESVRKSLELEEQRIKKENEER